jgi:hypothetical protein
MCWLTAVRVTSNAGRDLTGGEFVLSHQFEDRAPAGFGDRPQRFVGLRHLTNPSSAHSDVSDD